MALANPAAIRQYEGLKYSGDFTDAAHLAQLLRLGLLPEGYIYPAQGRQVRDLSRKRMQLVQCRTAQILAIENLFSRQTGGQMPGERVKRLDEAQVSGFGFAPDVALAMQANLAVMQTLQEEIGIIERRLMERVKLHPDYALLNSVPGIGPVLATTIMLETGTISRFARGWQFQLVLPLRGQPTRKQQQEEGRRLHEERQQVSCVGICRSGELCHPLVPGSQALLPAQEARKERDVAIKALAHKLARACCHMLREHKPIELARCFG
jgi:transposase